MNNNGYIPKIANGLSLFSGGLSLAVCILVLNNKATYGSGNDYTIGIFLVFITILAGFKAKSGGLVTTLILLPLLPGLNTQVEAITGLSILSKFVNGLELVSGFVLGVFIKSLMKPKFEYKKFSPPWPFGLLALILLLSAYLGIARNLWQSASKQSLDGLIYNLTRFNSLDWHDDYRPLTDLVSYLVAIAWLTVLIPLLKSSENRTQKVYRPIIIGLIISGTFGLIQVLTGLGAPGDRSDRIISIAAKGFAPDIHAFAGHMLLGVIGLVGYLIVELKKGVEKNIVGMTILISSLALIASKSRSSMLIALAVGLPIFSVWLWRKNQKIFSITFLSILTVIGTAVYLRYFHNHPAWFGEYLKNLAQYDVFNRTFGFRADMYIAAVRMFSAFPFFGLGLGDYYRMSADIGFSHSSIYSYLKGENAHNYFLQTLVETGILGSLVFIYVLIKPLLTRENRKQKLIAYIGFGGLCAGNIFAHSFLIRENLYLALSFIALAYAWQGSSQESANENIIIKEKKETVFDSKLIGTIVLVILILTTKEIIESFNKYPYKYGIICHIPRPKSDDQWLSGRYETTIPAGSKGININFAAQGKTKNINPVKIKITVSALGEGPIISKEEILKEFEPSTIYLQLPENVIESNRILHLELRTDRCFTPKNIGLSMDNRRLGVRLDSTGIEIK